MTKTSATNWDVIVVGGGAAGFFAAISAKSANPQLTVLVLEASQRVLTKVKISGGGRCNVTHACYDPKALLQHYPRGHRKLEGNFQRFGPTETVEWFESRGVALKTEEDGRLFPITDDSQTVMDCLQREIQRLGIMVQTGQPVAEIQRAKAETGFTLRITAAEQQLHTRYLILATGGSPAGYTFAESLGHECIAAKPSLFTFCVDDPELQVLSGISVDNVVVTLVLPGLASKDSKMLVQTGPLLVTHWGLSGPAILKLSAWGARYLADAHYQGIAHVDFFPDESMESLRTRLLAWKQAHYLKQLKNAPALLPQRLWHYLLVKADLNLEQMLDETKQKPFNKLSEQLKRWPFQITGKGQFKEEFVTAGGVPLTEIDLKTYESRRCPGLFIVGELLNIDGVTGGFNFQNAWTSGYIAGEAIGAITD